MLMFASQLSGFPYRSSDVGGKVAMAAPAMAKLNSRVSELAAELVDAHPAGGAAKGGEEGASDWCARLFDFLAADMVGSGKASAIDADGSPTKGRSGKGGAGGSGRLSAAMPPHLSSRLRVFRRVLPALRARWPARVPPLLRAFISLYTRAPPTSPAAAACVELITALLRGVHAEGGGDDASDAVAAAAAAEGSGAPWGDLPDDVAEAWLTSFPQLLWRLGVRSHALQKRDAHMALPRAYRPLCDRCACLCAAQSSRPATTEQILDALLRVARLSKPESSAARMVSRLIPRLVPFFFTTTKPKAGGAAVGGAGGAANTPAAQTSPRAVWGPFVSLQPALQRKALAVVFHAEVLPATLLRALVVCCRHPALSSVRCRVPLRSPSRVAHAHASLTLARLSVAPRTCARRSSARCGCCGRR